MHQLSSEETEKYAGLGLTALREILADLEAGVLTAAAAEAHIISAAAQAIDMVLPTGPFDEIDDSIIHDVVREVYEFLKDWAKRDSEEMREAAGRKLERVARAKSKGRKRIGIWSVEHVEDRANQLLVEADVLDGVRQLEG